MAENLYLSLILDTNNNQLLKIKTILIKIETAISFANLNVIHNTILNEFQLKEIIDDIPQKGLVQLSKMIYYYKIMIPQVKIINKTTIFAIHIPIINPKPFKLYKIYPIPNLNQTIIIILKVSKFSKN